MNLGKQTRLNRLFSHSTGRLCSVAIDHFINYGMDTLPPGLAYIKRTLEAIVRGKPDSVTMHQGIATSAWLPYAGKIPMILQSTLGRPDDGFHEQIATPADAVRLGADAFALAAFVRGKTEGQYLKAITKAVQDAAPYEMPVITHIYPRSFSKDGVKISFEPDDIAWAVRCALECGTDVIKVPYCNDVEAYAQIVRECPVPIVAAGGPKAGTLEEALAMLVEIVRSGARGAVVGRNIWSFPKITEAVIATRAVIHDGASVAEALKKSGLDHQKNGIETDRSKVKNPARASA